MASTMNVSPVQRHILWWMPAVLSATLGAFLHIPTLKNPLVWDDRAAVAYNKDVLGQSTLLELFSNDFWGQSMSLNDSHKSYRPLAVISLRMNHSYHGLDPYGIHVVNIILHSLCIMLVCTLVRLLLDKASFKNTKSSSSSNCNNESNSSTRKTMVNNHENDKFFISLFSGVVFAVHPVHTEVVASAVGRADLLCAFFALSSIVLYVQASGQYLKSNNWLLISLSFLLAIMATFSKEVGITTFVMLMSFELIEGCILATTTTSQRAKNAVGSERTAANSASSSSSSSSSIISNSENADDKENFPTKKNGSTVIKLRIETEVVEGSFSNYLDVESNHNNNGIYGTMMECCCAPIRTLSLISKTLIMIASRQDLLQASFVKILISLSHIISLILLHLSLHGDQMLRQWSVLENEIALIPDTTSRRLSFAWVC
jgi:hypothetical protein